MTGKRKEKRKKKKKEKKGCFSNPGSLICTAALGALHQPRRESQKALITLLDFQLPRERLRPQPEADMSFSSDISHFGSAFSSKGIVTLFFTKVEHNLQAVLAYWMVAEEEKEEEKEEEEDGDDDDDDEEEEEK